MSGFIKDPAAILDYTMDWSGWLSDGETVTAADWTVPEGLTQPDGRTPTVGGGKATLWLSGGTVGQSYAITCRVTTTQGRVDERTIRIRVQDR